MNGRRGFAIEITSLARARMTPDQRAEVHAWANDRGVRVYIWYRGRERRYEAVLSKRENIVSRQSFDGPFDAFRKAAAEWDAPAVISMFSGPAA